MRSAALRKRSIPVRVDLRAWKSVQTVIGDSGLHEKLAQRLDT